MYLPNPAQLIVRGDIGEQTMKPSDDLVITPSRDVINAVFSPHSATDIEFIATLPFELHRGLDVQFDIVTNEIILFPPHVAVDIDLNATSPFLIQPSFDLRLNVESPGKIYLRGEVNTQGAEHVNILMLDTATNVVTTAAVDYGQYQFDVTRLIEVMIIATQNTGTQWQPNTDYAVGDIVRPSRFNDRLYEVIEPGNGGSIEPSWWVEVSGVEGNIGSARGKVFSHFTPKVHGPIKIKDNE
ncbi:hypothetical protein N9R79_12565 [Vibrio sp.]|nr:hypothetical protein [Vibrio sp.]